MRLQYSFLSILLSFSCISLLGQSSQSGAAIVLNASGLVEAVAPDGEKVPGILKRGSVVTEGFTVSTGAFAESVLLFSNGTMATLNEKTAVRISIFSQEPFEAGNINFEGLQTEPSQSHLSLSLLNGSVVVKTIKLHDSSTFNIKTIEGLIRVKGTEFQLDSSQDKGVQLDVSESTVSFLPRGSTQSVQVNGGSGLDATKGATTPRPISPIAAQKISTKNRFATIISAKVPLSTIKQAAAKAQSVAGRSSSETEDDGAYEDEYEEELEGEESEAEKALATLQTSIRLSNAIVSDAVVTNTAVQKEKEYRQLIDELMNSTPVAKDYKFDFSGDNISIIFTDADEEVLKTLSYNESDFSNASPEALQAEFATLFGDDSKDIDALAVYVFLEEFFVHKEVDSVNFYSGLNKALTLVKSILVEDATYLNTQQLTSKEVVLKGSDLKTQFTRVDGYGKQAARIIGHYASNNNPDRKSVIDISEAVFDLFDDSKTSIAFGESSDDTVISLNTDLLKTEDRTQKTEVSLKDESSDQSVDTKISSELAKSDSVQIDSRQELEREIFKTDLDNLSVVSGRDITLGESGKESTFDLTSKLDDSGNSADRKSFAITATDDLHLKGDITFKNENVDDQNPGHDVLLLGAADHIEGLQYNSSERQKITNEGTHLVMGSYSHLTARNVDITTSGKLAIGSLEDLVLDTVRFDAGRANKNDNISLYSDQTLHLRNPKFDGRAQEIYMQGITVNLENVLFDATRAYHIRSKNGAHNFGSSNPGDVNFLGNNYWGSISADNKIDPDFFYPVSTKGDSVVDGYNSFETVSLDSGETAGIRIRKIQ